MLLGKDMTVQQFQEKFPELYSQIVSETTNAVKATCEAGFATERNALKADLAKANRQNKIMSMATKLCKVEASQAIIDSDMSVEDAYVALVDAPADKEGKSFSAKVFEGTSTEPVGNGGENAEVSNAEQAKAYVAEKFKLTSKSEITKKARREFPKFFVFHNPQPEA